MERGSTGKLLLKLDIVSIAKVQGDSGVEPIKKFSCGNLQLQVSGPFVKCIKGFLTWIIA